MYYWLIPLIAVGGLALVALITSAICFFMIFFAPRRKETEEFPIPPGEEYLPYKDRMIEWTKQTRALGGEHHEITSHDGLKLTARYFPYGEGAPIEILFHG